MITAEEAREKINALETERGQFEKKMVEEEINKTIEQCKYSCSLMGSEISKATEEWLKSLGYDVERIDSQRDGNEVKISWY